jgi:hypothetical protein
MENTPQNRKKTQKKQENNSGKKVEKNTKKTGLNEADRKIHKASLFADTRPVCRLFAGHPCLRLPDPQTQKPQDP